MNTAAKAKLIQCLELCKEFVKDNDTYYGTSSLEGGHNSYIFGGVVGSIKVEPLPKSFKSNDIRKEAEEKASKLERERKAAELLAECLNYLKTVQDFESKEVC